MYISLGSASAIMLLHLDLVTNLRKTNQMGLAWFTTSKIINGRSTVSSDRIKNDSPSRDLSSHTLLLRGMSKDGHS